MNLSLFFLIMPRSLTPRELEYLNRLIIRYWGGMNFDPLETPVSSNEDAMRLRLRRKAYRMLLDLFKLDKAGIINYGDNEECTVRNIQLLMSGDVLDESQMLRKKSLLLS
jgi:hypothetical protein